MNNAGHRHPKLMDAIARQAEAFNPEIRAEIKVVAQKRRWFGTPLRGRGAVRPHSSLENNTPAEAR
ncbi:MAG: hypothetical protein ACRBBS_16300 [Thalassovita sp.]